MVELRLPPKRARHDKSENQGAPPIAATPRPGAFTHRDARPATKAAEQREPQQRQETRQPRRGSEQQPRD